MLIALGRGTRLLAAPKRNVIDCHPERSEGYGIMSQGKKLAILAVCLTIGGRSAAQNASTTGEWHTFDRVCGRLYGTAVPERKDPQVLKPRKALSRVLLQLYQWQEGVPCCSGLNLVESVTTKRGGEFEFKKATSGRYFVVVNWNGFSPSLEITVAHKPSSRTVCSEQGLQIEDKDKLGKWMTITVD